MNVKQTVLFRRISAAAWTTIEPHLQIQELSTNTIVCTAGSQGDSLYYIVQGSVLLLVPADGDRELPVLTLQKGEYFGEQSVLQPGPRMLSAKTADNTTLARLTHASLEAIRAEDPGAHWEVVQTLIKLHAIKARIVTPDLVQRVTEMVQNGEIGPAMQ